jgi:hypothetical protein
MQLFSSLARRDGSERYVDENGLEIVKVIAQTDATELRAYVQSYEGRLLAHVRLFVRNKQGMARPTGKGIALEPHELPSLGEAVKALAAASKAASR